MANPETERAVDSIETGTARAPLLPDLAREVQSITAQIAGVADIDEDDDSGSWSNGDACIRMPISEKPSPCK